MGKTVISFSPLSSKEIGRATKEYEKYKREFEDKRNRLVERIANRIRDVAQHGFNGAIVDDLTQLSGGPVTASVNVRCVKRDNMYVIIANGEDAVWVEFGAGVYHNKGFSHPYSTENNLGFAIGGYGQGKGKRELWAFKDAETDEIKFSHGTPAKMPMYNAVQTVAPEIVTMAKEVFG